MTKWKTPSDSNTTHVLQITRTTAIVLEQMPERRMFNVYLRENGMSGKLTSIGLLMEQTDVEFAKKASIKIARQKLLDRINDAAKTLNSLESITDQ